MSKKQIVILMIIVLLMVFFFPKQNNIWDDSFTAHVAGQYKNMDCTCIGLTSMEPGNTRSDTQVRLCYGIPVDCRYSCKKIIDGQWQDVFCDRLD